MHYFLIQLNFFKNTVDILQKYVILISVTVPIIIIIKKTEMSIHFFKKNKNFFGIARKAKQAQKQGVAGLPLRLLLPNINIRFIGSPVQAPKTAPRQKSPEWRC